MTLAHRRLSLLALVALVTLVVAAVALAAPQQRTDGRGFGFGRRGPATLVGSSTSAGSPVLIVFKASGPGHVQTLQVTGLTASDRIAGLDVRPATGTLYGQGQNAGTSQNYVVQLNFADRPAGFDGKAVFSPIGARYATIGSSFGYDVNPTVDRVRVISEANDNKRVNPDTGVALTDGPIAYAAGDANAGKDPNTVGAGYLPAPFGGTTTLFDIDSRQDVLVTQTPANAGTLNTVGPLGVDTTDVVGFDIAEGDSLGHRIGQDFGPGTAYAALQPQGASASGLYRINLTTGRAVPARLDRRRAARVVGDSRRSLTSP